MTEPAPKPRCRLTAPSTGASCEFGVGETVRLGRSATNDFVCEDGSVASHHARAIWSEDVALPVVRNNMRPESLRVDGARVLDMAPLRDGARLELGAVEILVELLGLPSTDEQGQLLADFAQPESVEEVSSRLRALLTPRVVPDYELALPSVEDCLAALGRVMSPGQAEAVWSEACALAGVNPHALDEVETLDQVVQSLRRKTGLIQLVALSLSIRIDTYRCLRAKAQRS